MKSRTVARSPRHPSSALSPPIPPTEIGALTLRAARMALAVYWPALAVTTHWPHFHIDRSPVAGVPFDKWLHIGAFGVLTLLLIGACVAGGASRFARNFFVGLALAAVYAPIDELTQWFSPGRDVELGDALGNWAGVGAGGAAAFLAYAITRRFVGEAVAPASNVEGDAAVPVPSDAQRRRQGFVGAAVLVSVLTFVSRITGLVRDRINSVNFGQAGVADALAYGFQVPNLFRRLFGEGALTAAFIPVYTELLKKDRDLAGRFASACLALMALLLGAATLGAEVALWSLWRRAHSPDTELTLRLTMIMFPYMPLVCLVAMFGSILQVHGKFGPSAAQPILLNVVMSAAMVWATHGVHGESALRGVVPVVGWSVVFAGVWQCVSQGATMLRYQKLTLRFEGTRAALGTMMATFLPMLVALSVFQLNTFLDSNIALFLSPKEGGPEKLHLLGWVIDYPIATGGVAAFTRSMLLYQFPLGVFGIAIATAIFPALAHAAAERKGPRANPPHPAHDEPDPFRTILQHGLRLTLFIGLPASVGLFIARIPLCRTIFEGKAFTVHDSLLDASILAGFAPAIWAYSMTHVLTRGFYAVKDSRTPMRVSMMMVVLNLALNLTLVWSLGVRALALSTALCAVVQCAVLLRLITRHVDAPVDRGVLLSWARTAVLTLVMAAVLWPITHIYDPAAMTRHHAAIQGAVLVVLGAAVFGGSAWALQCEELGWLRRRGRG